jgi:tRNA 5-methylaminomethyl-2-thiouridine biosynthesis bifunctional protein
MVTRKTVGIIGAGLAGAACARALAVAGCSLVVFEAAAHPAAGASGNAIGILHQLYSKDHNLASQWVERGIETTQRWISELTQFTSRPLAERCGVLQLDAQASELIHWDPNGGWVRPPEFVQACLTQAQAIGVEINFGVRVESIRDDPAQSSVELSLRNQDGKIAKRHFDAVIVCAANDASRLLPHAMLNLNSIRGTISSYRLPQDQSLPCVICAAGYASPWIDGEMIVGASYERLADGEVAVSELGDELTNLDRLRIISAELAAYCEKLTLENRTSLRCATLDRMPHAGQVLDPQARLGASISQMHQVPRSSRIWALIGLGSRGLSSAPLGAEIIAAGLSDRVAPVSKRLLQAIDPVRFALRRHQRRKIS